MLMMITPQTKDIAIGIAVTAFYALDFALNAYVNNREEPCAYSFEPLV